MGKVFIVLGAINGFLSVALGAFGAHGLRSQISTHMLTVFQTGVQYQMYHALALLFIGLWAERNPGLRYINWSGGLLLAGILLFSGSLYLLAITGTRSLGVITPFGGICFLSGWVVLAAGLLKSGK